MEDKKDSVVKDVAPIIEINDAGDIEQAEIPVISNESIISTIEENDIDKTIKEENKNESISEIQKDKIELKNNNHNSNSLLNIVIIALIFAIVILIGYVIYKKIFNNNDNNNDIKNEEKYEIETPHESSLTNPLEVNQWGISSKKLDEKLGDIEGIDNYIDVPVQLKKIIKGEEAKNIIKNWFASQKVFEYEEPKANLEWILIDYDVDYRKVVFDENVKSITSNLENAVIGEAGGAVSYDGIEYATLTINTLKKDDITEGGIYSNQFISQIPKGCSNYFIRLGNSKFGSVAFYKGK